MQTRRWHASYPDGMSPEILVDEAETVASLIEKSFASSVERTAVACVGDTLTYGQLDVLSAALARYLLLALGLVPGDRVAVMLPSCAPFVLALTGILRASMTVVTVNPLYTPREIEQQLSDSGAVAIVASEAQVPALLSMLTRTALRQVLGTPVVSAAAIVRAFATGRQLANEQSRLSQLRSAQNVPLRTAIEFGAGSAEQPVGPQASDAAFLQYTGGTTGVSKGAVLTHRSVCASLRQMMSWMLLSLPRDDLAIVTPLPMYHVYPLAVSLLSLALGANNRLIPNPRDLPSVLAEMKRAPFAMFIGVNTLFNALVDAPDLRTVDFSATRLVTGAGASVQGTVAARWVAAGAPPITEGYGLTETSPSATFNPPGRNGTIGMPVPSTDARIVDTSGCDVALGDSGELLLRGPQLFAGYWNRPEETRDAFTADGWFKTGDIVRMDEAGFMYMVDRKKDMILVSGFNVYPNEIEGVVAAMPQVLECACIGVADARSGEVPHLFVVPRTPDLTIAEVQAHCRANLAAYKVPRHVTFVEALPKSTVGKILRRELRSSAVGSVHGVV